MYGTLIQPFAVSDQFILPCGAKKSRARLMVLCDSPARVNVPCCSGDNPLLAKNSCGSGAVSGTVGEGPGSTGVWASDVWGSTGAWGLGCCACQVGNPFSRSCTIFDTSIPGMFSPWAVIKGRANLCFIILSLITGLYASGNLLRCIACSTRKSTSRSPCVVRSAGSDGIDPARRISWFRSFC